MGKKTDVLKKAAKTAVTLSKTFEENYKREERKKKKDDFFQF